MNSIALKDFSLLKGLPASLLDEIAQLPVISLNEGEYIVRKGHKNYVLYLLVEGKAAVYLHEQDQPLKIIQAGENIGEISLIDQKPASASIVCLEHCRLIAISEEAIWKLAKTNHAFTFNLLQLMVERFRGVNNQVESAIEKQRLLEHHVSIDELTGLFNRRWLNKRLPLLLERCKKNGNPFSCIMIDIDHFKKVNDTYGHLCGDLVLQLTAEILIDATRAEDYVVRYGGEEMTVLLPNTDAKAAFEIAERIRSQIEANAIEYQPGKTLNITASLGIASLTADESSEELLKRADDALYYVKGHGRNQVWSDFEAEQEMKGHW